MRRKRKAPNVILIPMLAIALIVSLVSCKPKSDPAPDPMENVAQSEAAPLRPEDIPLPKVDSVQRKESTSTTPSKPVTTTPSEPVTATPATPSEPITTTPAAPSETTPAAPSETTPATPSDPVTVTPEPETVSYSYVLNTNTMRIHKPNCSSVNEMNPKNRQPTNESIAELEAEGYVKCKRCF